MPITPEALDFLFANRVENSRDWYEAHKPDYRRLVVEPMAQMVTDMTPAMLDIDDQFVCVPKIGKCISRVRRDTRFSRDKSLYRDSTWINFRRDKNAFPEMPSYFFEISPRGFIYGCGYYEASREILDEMRKRIIERDPEFLRANEAYRKQSAFIIEGDSYKRSRYPQESAELRNWLDRKDFCLIAYSDNFDLLFSDRITETVIEHFQSVKPIYRFLANLNHNIIFK